MMDSKVTKQRAVFENVFFYYFHNAGHSHESFPETELSLKIWNSGQGMMCNISMFSLALGIAYFSNQTFFKCFWISPKYIGTIALFSNTWHPGKQERKCFSRWKMVPQYDTNLRSLYVIKISTPPKITKWPDVLKYSKKVKKLLPPKVFQFRWKKMNK